MLLSVIIPAFNAAESLPSCVESVCAAAAGSSVEILLIDDGSTDGTPEIIRDLADLHACVRGIRQDNGGVSSARNRGLSAATGSWITFVDADDHLAPGCLADAAERLGGESVADFIIARSFCHGIERYPWHDRFSPDTHAACEELLAKGYLRGSICGCLFRRTFLQENGLRFHEGVALSEDTVFFGACLSRAHDIVFWERDSYRITERSGSASRNRDKDSVAKTAAAIAAAQTDIDRSSVRNYVLFKLILMLTSRAVDAGVSAEEASCTAGLDRILPLDPAGIGTERWKIHLLNAGYPLFYRVIALRNRLR